MGYSVKCSECDKEYIGENAGHQVLRTYDGKHLNSAMTEHTSTTSHHYIMDATMILVSEDKWFPRKIREALHILKRSPASNESTTMRFPPCYLHHPQVM